MAGPRGRYTVMSSSHQNYTVGRKKEATKKTIQGGKCCDIGNIWGLRECKRR